MLNILVSVRLRNLASEFTKVHREIIWLWLVKLIKVRQRNQQLNCNKICHDCFQSIVKYTHKIS